ncbi:hypothetical protein [Jannaschia sp. W003]|uniref:hypothetical protein n=1 Tax=Jannaschia sp. W003 TaxID=2867012 RepID=UPI0021A64914|nr:hypothetical protein [Jannaschia sp. W003]UWQ21016.1 hypothetical protein K3554_13720 [Jannaschia sp. W003]
MKTALTLATLTLATALAPAAAPAQVMASYYATIGDEDRRNSRGARLADPAAVIQQDRANFHRFGIRHEGDHSDPFFANPDLRAQIPALYARGRRFGPMEQAILSPGPHYVLVFVCGPRSQPTHINVDYADGDSHMGC